MKIRLDIFPDDEPHKSLQDKSEPGSHTMAKKRATLRHKTLEEIQKAIFV